MFSPPVLLTALEIDLGIGVEILSAGAGAVGSATWSGANRCQYFPLQFDEPGVITKLFCVNGAAVSGNVSMALYDSDGLVPTARIVTSGAVAQAGISSVQEFDITDTPVLANKQYFIALSCDNTTGAFQTVGLSTALLLRCASVMMQDTAHPCPSPATPVVVTTGNAVQIGVAFRTLVA